VSGTLPTAVLAARATLRSVAPTRVTVSHSLKRRTRGAGTQRWAWELTMPPMSRADWQDLLGFLVAQDGQAERFSYPAPPPLNTPRGSAPGTPVVDGAGQSGTTLATRGWTASQAGVLLRGDLFTIAGDAKVYMVSADADSDAAGKASLSIRPRLLTSPVDGAALTVSGVSFQVRLAADAVQLALMPPSLASGMMLSLVEDV